jgi:hypothetical protein
MTAILLLHTNFPCRCSYSTLTISGVHVKALKSYLAFFCSIRGRSGVIDVLDPGSHLLEFGHVLSFQRRFV